MDRIYSFSSVRAYNECPRKFYMRYVEKREGENPLPSFLEDGSVLHNRMEEAFEKGIVPAGLFKNKYAEQKFMELIEKKKDHSVYIEKQYYIVDLGEGFIAKWEAEEGDDVIFTGIIDIALENDEEVIVIEIKSGFRDVLEEQILVYLFPFYIDNPMRDFIGITLTPTSYIEAKIGEDEIEDAFIGTIQKIKQIERKIKKNPEKLLETYGYACTICEYRMSCPAFQKLIQIEKVDLTDMSEEKMRLIADKIYAMNVHIKELTNLLKNYIKATGKPVYTSDGSRYYEFVPVKRPLNKDEIKLIVEKLKENGIDPLEIDGLITMNWWNLEKLEKKYNLGIYDLIVVEYEGERFMEKKAKKKGREDDE